jgi:hypothetical protein
MDTDSKYHIKMKLKLVFILYRDYPKGSSSQVLQHWTAGRRLRMPAATQGRMADGIAHITCAAAANMMPARYCVIRDETSRRDGVDRDGSRLMV